MLRAARSERLSDAKRVSVLAAITAPTPALARRSSGLKIVLGLGALTIAGGVFLHRSAPAPAEPKPDSPPALVATAVQSPAPIVVAPSNAVAVEDLPSVAVPARTASRGERPARAASSTPAPAVEVAPPSDDLSAETALLRAVRDDLRANRTASALQRLDDYDARFPRGLMREEASVERVEALVRAGDRASARALGQRMLVERPAGPFARKLRSLVGDGGT